jgi:excisionase family DNA binding protein
VSRRRINAVAAQGAPVALGTNSPTNTAISATFAPAANSGAHAANVIAALAAMAIPPGASTPNFAQIPPERALAIAQSLDHLAGEFRLLAGSSRGDLALLRQLEPCHDSMDATAETAAIEAQSLTLSTKEFANALGIHPRTAQRMRAAGEGPKAIRVRSKVLYRRRDVDHWLEGKRS